MIVYKEYEKEVYNWLINKNKQDPNFTFSLRQNGSKGSELDYFIGTEKSRYFGITFWSIPVGFPGSSGDCIDLIFKLSADYLTYSYNFEFTQTNSPEKGQNTSVLQMIKSLAIPLENVIGNSYVSPVENKMFSIKTKSKKEKYSNLDEMLFDIDQELTHVLKVVSQCIEKEKLSNTEFVAHRISLSEFNSMQTKLEKRLIKYKKNQRVEDKSILVREQFSVWLKGSESSNKINSYLRAIDILNELLETNIYLENDINTLRLLYEDLKLKQKDNKSKYYYSEAPSYGNNGFYSASVRAFKEFLQKEKTLGEGLSKKSNNYMTPLNQILYGPPGTGKTYKTKELAVNIANPGFKIESNWDEAIKRRKIIEEYESLNNSGQIVFTTFHQSMSYEDFIEGIKPDFNTKGKISYDIKKGVFKKISEIAESNWKSTTVGLISKLEFQKAFNKLKEEWEEDEGIKFQMKREGNEFTITGFTESSIQFKKSSGGTGHTLSINTLEEGYYNRNRIRNTGVGIYYPPILKHLNSYQPFQEVKNNLNSYVLIIDEINRGNVSAIFGELITLLEDDKRLGEKEAIKITLPYSKDEFGVPSNLYIIGTMNTADKSVEALDTALRRRFEFKEMMPDYTVIENENIAGIALSEVLEIINKRIELLIDRDHTIGHSYFFDIDSEEKLANAFNNKIVPLLQEYFYGDYGKIGLVLGKGFVEKQKNDKIEFADFSYENANDFKTPSFNLKNVDENNIVDAVSTLLGNKESNQAG